MRRRSAAPWALLLPAAVMAACFLLGRRFR